MRAVCPSNHARGARCGRTARARPAIADRYRDTRLRLGTSAYRKNQIDATYVWTCTMNIRPSQYMDSLLCNLWLCTAMRKLHVLSARRSPVRIRFRVE